MWVKLDCKCCGAKGYVNASRVLADVCQFCGEDIKAVSKEEDTCSQVSA
jgi:hypothetical protein